MKRLSFQKDLRDYIGRRIVAAMREIKPELAIDDGDNKDEKECAEQEAVYLIGFADGLSFGELLTGKSADCKRFTDR